MGFGAIRAKPQAGLAPGQEVNTEGVVVHERVCGPVPEQRLQGIDSESRAGGDDEEAVIPHHPL